MNIIFSSYGLSNNYHVYNMGNVSNFLAQKHGYKTTLYCDENSELKDIPYNEIKILPFEIMKEIPRGLWSLSKIVALSEIQEPSLLLDLDLFLFKPLDEEKLKNDIIYFHDENYSTAFTDPLLSWCNNAIFNKVAYLKSNISRNCAMIGGNNVDTITNVAKEIIEFVIRDKNKWEMILKTEKNYQKRHGVKKKDEAKLFVPTLLIEQIWMFDLFKIYNKDVVIKPYFETSATLDSASFINGIFHVWGFKQDAILNIINKFSETEIDYNKSYKDFNYDVLFLKDFENLIDKNTNE